MNKYEKALIDSAVRWYKYGSPNDELISRVADLLADRKQRAAEPKPDKDQPSEWWAASEWINLLGPYHTQRDAWAALVVEPETRAKDGRIHHPGAYVFPVVKGSTP